MSDSCQYAAVARPEKRLYGVQFHPEVELSTNGIKIIQNFLYRICGAAGDYSVEDYLNKQIAAVREQVGSEKVLLGLSGGVDSAVCAALLARAIPDRLICIFVDHGLMRKDEGDSVEKAFSNMALRFVRVDASDRFLKKLEGVTDPEKKRKIIGSEFVDVFYEQAKKFGDAKFLAQGTIYPDVIESGTGSAATIKSHHNVGGLPKEIRFAGIIEPLRAFSRMVRKLKYSRIDRSKLSIVSLLALVWQCVSLVRLPVQNWIFCVRLMRFFDMNWNQPVFALPNISQF